jgi:hypothetical protein
VPFAIIALPYDALKDLPPLEFKTLTALLRYVDKLGRCWPTLKQLAADVGRSEATMSRVMARLDHAYGVFDERVRRDGGRYRYTVNARFLPRWPGKQRDAASGTASTCSVPSPLAQRANGDQANPSKYVERGRERPIRSAYQKAEGQDGLLDMSDQWKARIGGWQRSGGRFWLPQWGPRPNEPGHFIPPSVLTGIAKAG